MLPITARPLSRRCWSQSRSRRLLRMPWAPGAPQSGCGYLNRNAQGLARRIRRAPPALLSFGTREPLFERCSDSGRYLRYFCRAEETGSCVRSKAELTWT